GAIRARLPRRGAAPLPGGALDPLGRERHARRGHEPPDEAPLGGGRDRGGAPRPALPRPPERVPADEHGDGGAAVRARARRGGSHRRRDGVRPLLRDRHDRPRHGRAGADRLGRRRVGGVGRVRARERRPERGRERGLLRRQRRAGARGAPRPSRAAGRRRRRPAARRARRQGAQARRRGGRAAARLRLLQPDDARRRREAARRRPRLPPRAGAAGRHVPAHTARRDRRPPHARMSLYDLLAELPLRVERYELDRLEQQVSSGFTRVTTVIRLRGAGEEGVGEDVTYQAELHPPPHDLPLAGEHRLGSFSDRLDEHDFHPYRRWAFESAALDLALREAGRSLAQALGRDPRPVTFVVSKRFETIGELRRLLERYPTTRFKLDPTSDWGEELVGELAATGAVDTADLKGAYHGTVVDQLPDPALYRRVAEGFPSAWIEDPALTPETDPVLAPHRDRITWDAPIHSVADVDALPFPPRALNVKPSRFGPLRELLAFY